MTASAFETLYPVLDI